MVIGFENLVFFFIFFILISKKFNQNNTFPRVNMGNGLKLPKTNLGFQRVSWRTRAYSVVQDHQVVQSQKTLCVLQFCSSILYWIAAVSSKPALLQIILRSKMKQVSMYDTGLYSNTISSYTLSTDIKALIKVLVIKARL